MRYVLLASAVLLTSVAIVASAAELPAPAGSKRTVYLDRVALEEMQKSDATRYAQVRRVMAAGSEICGPNAARLWSVANIQSANCSSALLKTSYPPKREIGFLIEDTWYVALVTVRDKPALLIGGPDKAVPLEPAK
jgi:hypothetical protein